MAAGSGRERIHVMEPTGPIEDDPRLTDKRCSDNPTLSFA
ncbi:MAG: NAD(+)--rifampin ADP-ribosyltransferase [Trueperaceae bacterium]|nr:NAD(+)--rifampin ADP-ribosyltransferase [Trueperaceae bacterium]